METGIVKLWDYSKPIKERHRGPCGPYYFKRGALRGKGDKCKGFGGYLSRNGREVNEGAMCRLRVIKAGEVINLRHTGWYCDEDSRETLYGVVARLPNNRGFLAGWSFGEGMSASFAGDIYDDIKDAARAADEEARCAAEAEREYQEKWRAEEEAREAEEVRQAAADKALAHFRSEGI